MDAVGSSQGRGGPDVAGMIRDARKAVNAARMIARLGAKAVLKAQNSPQVKIDAPSTGGGKGSAGGGLDVKA